MVRVPAFQAGYTGSIPVTRSKEIIFLKMPRYMGCFLPDIRPCSSAGQSSGLLSQWSQVRILPGAPRVI
jgi:hypothetical protein